jgi:hypothetical protein
MPTHSAAQALLYVLLLQPQTGSYCMVQTQFGLGVSLHLEDLQEKTGASMAPASNKGSIRFI